MTTHSEFLSTLPTSYLECRDLRHQWEASGTYTSTLGVVVRKLDCPRCSTTKFQVIEGGRVTSTTIKYPTDYVKAQTVDKGRIAREVVLSESIGRTKMRVRVPASVAEFMQRRGLGVSK